MDFKDSPQLFETFSNQEKLDQISYVIRCACEGLMSHDQALEAII